MMCRFVLSGGCLRFILAWFGFVWGCCVGGIVNGLFCLEWVVCINRAEFSGVVWSVLVGLGLL